MKHTAQDGLLVPCLQGYRIPIQGELRKKAQVSKAGELIKTGQEDREREKERGKESFKL